MLVAQDVSRSLPLLRAMCHDDLYGRLGEIPVTTRVLCGELDRTCPAWHSQRLASELPAATARLLPGAGHMLNYEAPDAVCDAVVND
jgi:pimeloyl-ACP methyl ester carboxylesterase